VRIKRLCLVLTLVTLSLLGVGLVGQPRQVSAVTGTHFDHVVIIAMENTPYASVFGSGTASGCPTSSAPFLCSMLPYSSTVPSMNNYGATLADANDFNGCSAACYAGFMGGYTYGVSDNNWGAYSGATTLVQKMAANGLTWQAFCESGCPRGNDHFPFTAVSGLNGNPNIFTGSSVAPGALITAANLASPPNLLWFTPTDGHNMHDNSVSSGDSYVKSFLVGTGFIGSPSSGSLLASNLFTNTNFKTLLYLWWDECGGNNGSCDSNNDTPNLFYGSTVKQAYVSSDSTGIDEYACLWTIENNWGLLPLAVGDTAAQTLGYSVNDIFTNGGSSALSASFNFSPSSSITINKALAFSASAQGGTGPYTYSWTFGDGTMASGANPTHMYTVNGTYTITMTTTDNNGQTTTKTQQVTVGQTSPGSTGSNLFPTLSLLAIGLILGGAAGTVFYLARYRARNHQLRNAVENRSPPSTGVRCSSKKSQFGRNTQKTRQRARSNSSHLTE
jgi:PKD repeat protein